MSSTPVVLNAIDFTVRCVAAHADRQRQFETKKPEDSDTFSEVEHKHLTPATVLTMHALTSSLYMLQ